MKRLLLAGLLLSSTAIAQYQYPGTDLETMHIMAEERESRRVERENREYRQDLERQRQEFHRKARESIRRKNDAIRHYGYDDYYD